MRSCYQLTFCEEPTTHNASLEIKLQVVLEPNLTEKKSYCCPRAALSDCSNILKMSNLDCFCVCVCVQIYSLTIELKHIQKKQYFT